MDEPTRKGLLREANEMRSVARRLLRMRADQTDVADQDRLAAYAAHLEEYASELEEETRSPAIEPRPTGCVESH
jgi:hypothetical protein